MIFAGFASIGRTEFVFVCNAVRAPSCRSGNESLARHTTDMESQAVAIVGFVVLLFARFPLEGSRPLDKEHVPMPVL